MNQDYKNKYKSYIDKTLFNYLDKKDKEFLKNISGVYRLTFQEFNMLVNAARDLEMWNETLLYELWKENKYDEKYPNEHVKKRKEKILKSFFSWFDTLREFEKEYPPFKKIKRKKRSVKTLLKKTSKKIFGLCPVASPDTLCCKLNTIDAVESCSFACSYCTIQTFYGSEAVFDKDFKDKLDKIIIDPDKYMRFGSGQSSDSLIWGNKYNVLGDLLDFAEKNPNILLELKTKSDNIECLLDMSVPRNIVCTWSLNPDTIISNEEHLTPGLNSRLEAARRAADKGIKTGFHFHPMIFYKNWERDYSEIIVRIKDLFKPEEVLFISFGTVTFIKPVIKKIRENGGYSKILQMPFSKDPKGKLTYPDEIKIKLYKHIYSAFYGFDTYYYLCMEKKAVWDAVFGYSYSSNDQFEKEFGKHVMKKINQDA